MSRDLIAWALALKNAGSMINPMESLNDLIIGGNDGTPTRLAVAGLDKYLHTNASTGNIEWSSILSYKTFNPQWDTTHSTADFCTSVVNDAAAVAGMCYLGKLYCTDLPESLSQAEAIVEIISNSSDPNGKAINIIITSVNVSPYIWFYSRAKVDNVYVASGWNSGSIVSVSNTGTATDEVQYITINGTEKKIAGVDYDTDSLADYVEELFLPHYDITMSVTHGDYTGSTDIPEQRTRTITIIPSTGYFLPISITINGVTGISGSIDVTWSYDNTTGVITLTNATDDLSITVVCGGSRPTPKASLSDYTWAEIKELADLVADQTLSVSDLSTTYHIAIGDTKSSTINGETHNYRLIGLRHDVDASDNYLGMTFEQANLMNSSHYMKSNRTATNASWNNSDLKTTINAFTIASDLDAVITAAKKPCAYSVSSGTPLTYVTTKLWIESETEVFNTQANTQGGTVEGSQYQYYANGGSAKKSSTIWWLRSPYHYISSSMGSSFACVNTNGTSYNRAADGNHGVVPCFCI